MASFSFVQHYLLVCLKKQGCSNPGKISGRSNFYRSSARRVRGVLGRLSLASVRQKKCQIQNGEPLRSSPSPGKRLNYMAVFALPALLHKQDFGPAVVAEVT